MSQPTQRSHDDRVPSRRRIVACVLPALLVPFVGSLAYFFWLAGSRAAPVVYGVVKSFTVLWPIAATVIIERRWLRRRSIDWSRHFRALPAGAVTGVIMGGGMVAGYFLTPLGDYVGEFGPQIGGKLASFGLTTETRYVVFVVILALVHSAIEEFYWRWFVFGRLRQLVRPGIAHAAAALAFAGHHYVSLWSYFSPAGAIVFGSCVGGAGVVWSIQYSRSRSLAGCWLSHVLSDAAIFWVGYQLAFARAAVGS